MKLIKLDSSCIKATKHLESPSEGRCGAVKRSWVRVLRGSNPGSASVSYITVLLGLFSYISNKEKMGPSSIKIL